ncbi:hypothetical protein QG37_04318 [Candidozyma auris]|uniref:Uncharacterized protein n=1 Tax=Candidozyma auris TaxID=498019 RepID=A0A0L0NXV8_CANAR|nr:hypothetical protein QG37_04318 [[Candida] auris]
MLESCLLFFERKRELKKRKSEFELKKGLNWEGFFFTLHYG